MAIRVDIHHRTSYKYDRPVVLGPQVTRLRPSPHCRTPIHAYTMKVTPDEHFLNWVQDPQSNWMGRLVFPEPTTEFEVVVDLIAELYPINPFDFFLEESAEKYPFSYEDTLEKYLEPYLEQCELTPLLKAFVDRVDVTEQNTIDFIVQVNQLVNQELGYLIRMDPGVQEPQETLELGQGSCRDFSWLMVHVFRHLGLAARFVSGYSVQLQADIKSIDGPSGVASDVIDLHAWVEVYLPGAGWVGVDATSGLLCGEGHIPLCATPDPGSAAPIEGGLTPAKVEFAHEMSVTRVHEDPRVTKPYTEEQWASINQLGQRVDADLATNDVRLTMGGEPTFVSQEFPDDPQWNTAALGKEKREKAEGLLKRLRAKFGPGGLMHYGQGKWYPGEEIPRWAITCMWRKDGEPIWQDDQWMATDQDAGKAKQEDTASLLRLIAANLGVDQGFVQPVYEDKVYQLWKESKLPENLDPDDERLNDPEFRSRFIERFHDVKPGPRGYILPLYRKPNPGWVSSEWPLRDGKVFLIPGDSPIGYRLPLDALPWALPEEMNQVHPLDPFAPRQSLREYDRMRSGFRDQRLPKEEALKKLKESDEKTKRKGESNIGVIRTTLCVELKEGILSVFLPPTHELEHYLEIIEAVEYAASTLGLPVRIEGYGPPHDHRISEMKVTPDPGVLELNIHPTSTWSDMVDLTETIYEEARYLKLATEKFEIDGRHTGTGGGNHIVMGAADPVDSPFLRRPDVLRSLIAFWLNHPSLSYLFSGMFIGPTSQAPRVDEARKDSVYELQLAFDQIPESGPIEPWLVDRILRNLLIDVTGNTHRAEFCIDKLYSPDSSAGRLGLLEMRAFEMPPHARMSLAQQLLVRACIAAFWKQPYKAELMDWNTRLHDQFMLPTFVKEDFHSALRDLRQLGYDIDPDWFTTHFEFRFPVYGHVIVEGMELELRQAIEPWNVMGEETTSQGTARYVDSSVERLQVKVSNWLDHRYLLTCNGRQVPLKATGVEGEAVAGVRFRAWQPPSCLHPLIPVHAPLVFDVLDQGNARSIGGCTYYVSHPGGRSHETRPINALEAETRRVSRFSSVSYTPGTMSIPPLELNPHYPCTLDLRRSTLGY